ncbi:MAG: carbohydrate-binding domain-containing protein [Firmicutes bacterium]|nr:carbohydrate-binding domain-containing protein [Bacillota bacterium]
MKGIEMDMKKTIMMLLFAAISFSLIACKDASVETIASLTTSTLPDIDLSMDVSDEYSDWEETEVVSLYFDLGNVVSSDYAGIQVGASTVIFTQANTYVLNGSYQGTLIINAPSQEVRLIFNNVEITASQGAALIILDADKVILSMPEGTINSISDSTDYGYGDSELMNVDAALYSKSDLVINGLGFLTIYANYQDGIKANDSLVLSDIDLKIYSVDDAINVNDFVLIQSGVYNIEAGGDGIKVSHDDLDKGYIAILDGEFNLEVINDGIQSSSYIVIEGGNFNIISGGGSTAFLSSDQSSKGLKASLGIRLNSGVICINSSDDSLHSDNLISIQGGYITLESGDEAIHSDDELNITNGEISITKSFEGMEALNIYISGGIINIIATDDGINGADPDIDAEDALSPNETPSALLSTAHMEISGGVLIIEAEDDGIDINGTIYQSGGLILINGPVSGMQSVIDYDLEWVVTGGTIIGVSGYGAESKTPSESSTQTCLLYNTKSIQASGTTISVQDSDGNFLFAFTPNKSFQAITIVSSTLELGQSYTLYLGGTITGELTDGYYINPLIEDARVLGSVTISSIINYVNATILVRSR